MCKIGETLAAVLDDPEGWQPRRIYYLERDGVLLTFERRMVATTDKEALERLFALLVKDEPRLLHDGWAKIKYDIGVANEKNGLFCHIPNLGRYENTSDQEKKTLIRTLFTNAQIATLSNEREKLRWIIPFRLDP
ncbi:MAG: hypothetical protein WC725_04080 [Patescibacteria group bacterium]|jgi:hypothetical protein